MEEDRLLNRFRYFSRLSDHEKEELIEDYRFDLKDCHAICVLTKKEFLAWISYKAKND